MSITTARRLAGEHPAAMLPCPVCAGSVKGENLDKHVAKVHPGATDVAMPWRGRGALGVFPCSIAIVDDALVLRFLFGLRSRVVPLPCSIEAGGLWKTQPNAVLDNVPGTDVKAGRYMRLACPRSRIAIGVGCRGGVPLSGHWTGWTQGPRRRRVDVVVAREAMVALEYALAERGLLVPGT